MDGHRDLERGSELVATWRELGGVGSKSVESAMQSIMSCVAR